MPNDYSFDPYSTEMIERIPEITQAPYARARKRAIAGLAFRGMRTSPIGYAGGGPLTELETARAGQEAGMGFQVYGKGAELGWRTGERESGQEWRTGEREAGQEFDVEMYERRLADAKKMQEKAVLNQLLGGVAGAFLGPTVGAAGAFMGGSMLPGITGKQAGMGYIRGLYGMMSPREESIYRMMYQGIGGGGGGGGGGGYDLSGGMGYNIMNQMRYRGGGY